MAGIREKTERTRNSLALHPTKVMPPIKAKTRALFDTISYSIKWNGRNAFFASRVACVARGKQHGNHITFSVQQRLDAKKDVEGATPLKESTQTGAP